MAQSDRSRKAAAAVTAAVGSLAAPAGAEAMLPADGGPPPKNNRADKDLEPTTAPKPAKPAPRDPGPAAQPQGPPPGKTIRQLQEDRVQPQPAVRRTAPPQKDFRPAPQAGHPTRPSQLVRRDTPARQETPAREETPLRRDVPMHRAGPAPEETPVHPTGPQGETTVRERTEPTPAPEPAVSTPPGAGQTVQQRAERYAGALDHLDRTDNAPNQGTANALALGSDQRVVRRAKTIRATEQAEAEATRQAERKRAEKAADDARVVRQGNDYMRASESLADGEPMNPGISRNLAYGQDPEVKGFVDEVERMKAVEQRRVREREERQAVRRKAETYVGAQDQLELNGGFMSLALNKNLQLGRDPEVKRVAERVRTRREAERERAAALESARAYLERNPTGGKPPADPTVRRAVREIEQRRATRAGAERYAGALRQLELNGNAMNGGIARTFAEYGDDERVKTLAKKMREEDRNAHKQALFGPVDGPTLRDPTLGIAMPYPGAGEFRGLSFEQECMLQKTPTGALGCLSKAQREKRRALVDITSSISGKVSRGDPQLTENGDTYETLGLSVDIRQGLRGTGKLPEGIALTLAMYQGGGFSYKTRVTSERAQQIADGKVKPPNPIDPNSLRAGESITMDKESYQGNSQGAAYKLLTGQLSFEEGRRLSSAVQRLENGKMRVLVGDEEFIKNAVELKLGVDELNVAAGVSNEFAHGDLRSFDIDPKKREGWDTYQHFVTSGELPEAEGQGVENATSTDKASWSGSSTLQLNVGPAQFGGTSTPFEGDVTETRHSDGTVDYALTDRDGSVTYLQQAKKKAGQNDYGPSEYSLLLKDVDSSTARLMTDLHGADDSDVDGESQNLRVRFTEADLEQIQQDAIEQLSYHTREAGDQAMTPDEVRREAKRGYYDAQFPIPGGATYLKGLATARNTSEVLHFIQTASHGSSSALAHELSSFQMLRVDEDGQADGDDTSSPPGTVDVYDD